MESIVDIVSQQLGLKHLKDNVTTIIFTSIFYQIAYTLGGIISSNFIASYRNLDDKTKSKWKIKICSFINATLVCSLSIPILFDENLKQDMVFGRDRYSETVYALACGYFLWDILYVLIENQGIGFLLHGVSCFSVYFFSFSPFLNYYGAVFLLFELSTPFLDLIFFLDKTDNSNSIWMVINGICLLISFFLVRIVFGIYMSYKTFKSVLQVIDRVGLHLQLIYGVANIALNILNIFWFYKMISMFLRRLKQKGQKIKKSQ